MHDSITPSESKLCDVRNPEFSTTVASRAEGALVETQKASINACRKVAKHLDLPADDNNLQQYNATVVDDLNTLTR